MSAPPAPSSISDPTSLGKIQVLLVPVPTPNHDLSEQVYEHWSGLVQSHATLRGDEIRRPYAAAAGYPNGGGSGHTRGSGGGDNPKARFFPPPSGTSISKTASHQHIHLAFPAHPPARHLYPLSLLRMASFPLVVIGVAVNSDQAQGYSLKEDGEEQEDMATPQIATPQSEDPVGRLDEAIASLFPASSPYPLVKRLLLVPPTLPSAKSARSSPTKSDPRAAARSALEGGSSTGSAHVVRAPAEGSESWVGKVLGEVIGEVLSELGETAAALETPAGLKTLSSTLLPSLTSQVSGSSVDTIYSNARGSTPLTEIPPPRTGSAGTPSASRDTLQPGPSISRSLTPGGRPVSIQAPSLPPLQTNVPASSPPVSSASSNPFRRSTAISSPFSRSTSAASIGSTSSAQSATSTATATATSGTAQKYTSANLSGLAGGRLMKLLGDMYLLAGMYADAIKCFDDGAERCRAVGDVLWEGMAREGRAVAGIGEAWEGRDGSNSASPFPTSPIPNEIQMHFLSALACVARAPLPYPPTILSPSPMAVSGSLSFAAPSTGSPSHVGTGEGLLAYLHTNLTLRIARFMLVIWASGGWGSIALSCLMGHSLPRSFPTLPSTSTGPLDRRKRRKDLATLGHRSQIPRHEVYSHVDSALGAHHHAMTKTERISLLVEAVWMARWLDLTRKEAMVTRALVKQLALVLVEARDEARRGGSTRHTKDAESVSASVGLGLGMSVPSSRVAVRRKESTEGNGAIIKLIERTVSALGIDLLSLSEDPTTTSTPDSNAGPSKRYGWADLQVETLKEAIAVSEVLSDHPTILRLCVSALHALCPFLTPTSQAGLAKLLPQSLGVVRRRGLEIGQIPWWVPGKLVLSVEVASMSGNRIPREHARDEIAGQAGNGKKDFFLYNPRPKVAEAGKTVIVANEQVDIYVNISNPLAFDLEVADLSLITSGVTLTASPLPCLLPAASLQMIRISAIASEPGTLHIKGVRIRLPDGSSTEILLPVIDDEEKQKRDKRKSRLSMDVGKIKRSGTEARHSLQLDAAKHGHEDEGRWLECIVIEEQPLVWIKKTSLTHGTVMLYHGESSTIRLTLENSSSTPVDLVKLSFDDSTAREAQAVIAEGELSPEHAYELDWDQLHRPALTWENSGETSIPPGGRVTLLVKCYGKIGCTDGSIRIDYGYVNRSTNNASRTFHTRQIAFPILFTVYHHFEPHSLDLMRFEPATPHIQPSSGKATMNGSARPKLTPSSSSLPNTPRRTSFAVTADDELKRHLQDEADDGHCLVSLSVRNVFGVPFEVALHRKNPNDPDSEEVASSRLIPPGSTEKLVLPIPRIHIPAEQLAQPIPSLTDRQYVVDKSRKSAEQLKLEREVFWYRDALLKTLYATWSEPGSRRTGDLSLRGQPLNLPLLDVLRKDELDLRLSLPGRPDGQVTPTDFIEIATAAVNRLDRPVRLRVTLEPLPLPQADGRSRHSSAALKNLLIDGNRSKTLPVLEPGQSDTHILSVVFLAKGTYTFRAVAQEITDTPGQAGLIKSTSILSVHVK